MAIFTCGVCRTLHEMGEDHRGNEPCTDCHKLGWRLDGAGNIYRFYCKERVLFSKPSCQTPCHVCTSIARSF